MSTARYSLAPNPCISASLCASSIAITTKGLSECSRKTPSKHLHNFLYAVPTQHGRNKGSPTVDSDLEGMIQYDPSVTKIGIPGPFRSRSHFHNVSRQHRLRSGSSIQLGLSCSSRLTCSYNSKSYQWWFC